MATGRGALEASAGGIEYRLVLRKGMRSMRIRVLDPDGTVVVSAGTNRSRREIDRFVSDHAGWIRKRQSAIAGKKPRFPIAYGDGEAFSLWDQPMTLRVRRARVSRCSSERIDDELVVTVPPDGTPADVERAFKSFMRAELQRALDLVVPRCEFMTGIECAGVQIRDMSSRWGSCTSKTRRIRVALKLASYPPECLVMIMVHELAHIRHHGHDRAFYAFMDERYPRWREVQALLKE